MSFTPNRKPSQHASAKKIKLKDYQVECIKFGLEHPEVGLFLAPGLGKTLIMLYVFKILKKLGLVDNMLVLAKRRIVYQVWRQEVKKWGLPFTVTRLHGPRKDIRLHKNIDIYLMNYEGLRWLAKTYNKRMLFCPKGIRERRIMLVIDESSKLRNSRTQRFRLLKGMLHKFVRRYILTGSPATKGLINLFGQIYVLDLGHALGGSLTQYRNEYFYPTGFMGYQWEPKPDAEKRIFKRLRPLVLRYGADRLKLPPLTVIDRWVALPPRARKLYDKVEREFVGKWKKGEVVAANAAVATGKCRQIANGGVFIDGKEWETIHDEKCADLLELLEELQGEPALVAFEFKHDLLRAQRFFKDARSDLATAPAIAGGTTDKAAADIQRAWDRGALPLLWGHPDSVAYGLNLQGKGGIVVYFSMTWSLENYEQFYQRVYRQGQKRRVLVYRILARDTIDEAMIYNIAERDKTQKRILRALEHRYGIPQ